MKRFFCIFFTGVLMMTGVVYGAEPEVLFYRNAEIVLQDRPFCRNGKWMVSLRDLERLTGTQAKEEENGITLQKAVTWERMKEAEPQFIDDVGFTIYAARTEDNMDGITPVARRVYADLPAGQYRMGIPFSYRYHLQNVYGNPWDEYFEKGEAEKLGWDFYYSTHWGEPDFYFEGAGLSTTNGEKDTHYMLYGEFEVK